MSPMRDVRCVDCRRIQVDIYFKSTDEIEFECVCGCREYELMPSRVNLPKDGTYSYLERKKEK